MPMSKGELKGKILRILHKTAANQGFYTSDKLDDTIEDCLDYIAAEMFMAGKGAMNDVIRLNTVAGANAVDIPPFVSIINFVRYYANGFYVQLDYDDGAGSPQSGPQAAETAMPSTYRIVGNKFYFNPPPALTGTEYLEVEYSGYPRRLNDDNAMIDPQFDNAMLHYTKWRSASMLVSGTGKAMKEWKEFEDEWKAKMITVVGKRITTTTYIREFGG